MTSTFSQMIAVLTTKFTTKISRLITIYIYIYIFTRVEYHDLEVMESKIAWSSVRWLEAVSWDLKDLIKFK